MNATELAGIVEGWATLGGLFVLIAGAIFAGSQLRQEARARHLQAVMAVLSDIRPPAVVLATQRLGDLPDGYALSELNQEDRDAHLLVGSSYGRLGTLLAMGLVEERDIFPFLALSRGAIDVWEKMKHATGAGEAGRGLANAMFNEFLAARAQAYLEREGVKTFGRLRTFESDPDVLARVGSAVQQARATAR